MCAECDNGPTLCENSQCELRLVYCVQPYGSSATDVGLPPQPSLGGDNFTFPEGPLIQNRVAPPPSRWERSNPYTRELNMWMVRE